MHSSLQLASSSKTDFEIRHPESPTHELLSQDEHGRWVILLPVRFGRVAAFCTDTGSSLRIGDVELAYRVGDVVSDRYRVEESLLSPRNTTICRVHSCPLFNGGAESSRLSRLFSVSASAMKAKPFSTVSL